MKLTFNGTEIPKESDVYFRNKAVYWVRYNDIIVWGKDISENVPRNLTASEGLVNRIFVDWAPPVSTDVPDYYKLYRDGKLYKNNLTESFYDDTGLSFNESHEYFVTAVYGAGESNPSNSDYGSTKAVAGSQTFTEDGYFIVPEGVTKVKICMIAGGNSGMNVEVPRWDDFYRPKMAGGKAGKLIDKIVNVFPGQKIKVRIGSGGRRPTNYDSMGGQGGLSSFGTIVANPSEMIPHYGKGTVTGESGCGLQCQKDGGCENCWDKIYIHFRNTWTYGGQGTIFGEGGGAGYSHHKPFKYWKCGNNPPRPKKGTGYGTGGGGTVVHKSLYMPLDANPKPRVAAGGEQGVCIVSWGTEITSVSENTSSINTLNNLLGYDVLEKNFLNRKRYVTKSIKEQPEFLSKDILSQMDEVQPWGEYLKQMEDINVTIG